MNKVVARGKVLETGRILPVNRVRNTPAFDDPRKATKILMKAAAYGANPRKFAASASPKTTGNKSRK